jgi:hypothetical protein
MDSPSEGKIRAHFVPAPQRDGEQVSVKIKSPVPMVVAILPSDIADIF